ncbi:MAG: response regulator, partial [Clostridiales bacterium]|nr:response regulator [Clostridiales bacterium]
MNILVVDDEKFNLAVAKSFVENLLPDAHVITCSKPEEVIPLISKERVDILMLDIIMPGMSGFDLLQAIRYNQTLGHEVPFLERSILGGETTLR